MMRHFYNEMLLLKRRAQTWLYPLCFFTLVICLFPLAFSPDPVFLQEYIAGCIWIAALLASLMSAENIFFTDIEDGFLEQLLLGDVPLNTLVLIKMAAHWLVAALPLIILTPLLGLLFNLSASMIIALCMSLLAGTPALLLIAAFAAALSIGLRQQGAMLGLLILPLVTPVLIFGVSISHQLQAGFSIVAPLAFLAAISLFAIALLPWAIAAALRTSVDD